MKRKSIDKLLRDLNFNHYMVQYQGDIEAEVEQYPNFNVTIINDEYAIVSVKGDIEINVEGPYFSTIVYVKLISLYTLQQISPIDASQATFLQLDLPLNLTGKGVDVAIIDTGIDYLNAEFMNGNGETRVQCIWDQTIISSKEVQGLPVHFGTVYTKDDIQQAINAEREGRSPYDIVPSIDEIGHGTGTAGIIGAIGKNPNFRGVVPECNFVVVKLMEDIATKYKYKRVVPAYNITAVFPALDFVYRYALSTKKPMVIYFPLGNNLSSHDGNDFLEQFIELISIKKGITFVKGSGNQRLAGEHTFGFISQVGERKEIELDISPEKQYLLIEIWVDIPNIISLDIVSPSGESTGIINAAINATRSYRFIFETTSVKVNFYLPEVNTGDELIRIIFSDLQPGIWRLGLIGDVILDGRYNIWMNQSDLTPGTARFTPSDKYGTITTPISSKYIITVAAYNQNNNNIADFSGVDFVDNKVNLIDVAAGGVDAITIAPNNKTTVASGTSVASAIVAGACAMLFQWGIVDGNDPYMYTLTLKTYLTRGTMKRSGDIYPNPQWGYGVLNIVSMFENIT